MVVRPSGRVMLVKAHSSSALLPIEVSAEGSVTEVQLICMAKAQSGTLVMFLLISIFSMPVQYISYSPPIGLNAGLFQG